LPVFREKRPHKSKNSRTDRKTVAQNEFSPAQIEKRAHKLNFARTDSLIVRTDRKIAAQIAGTPH
jgi:hypothetical protein